MQDGQPDARMPRLPPAGASSSAIGIELVRDRDTREPAHRQAATVVNRMQERGVLLSTDGPLNNVIKIKPPMVLSADDVDMFLRGFDDVLVEI